MRMSEEPSEVLQIGEQKTNNTRWVLVRNAILFKVATLHIENAGEVHGIVSYFLSISDFVHQP
ncbi:hypothetical protein D3261_03825 [Halococcus sp. IIIV-5B]|nr:hypothetical protein D3261_03825 [Halococcus sp. IIIV-5B]